MNLNELLLTTKAVDAIRRTSTNSLEMTDGVLRAQRDKVLRGVIGWLHELAFDAAYPEDYAAAARSLQKMLEKGGEK